MHLPVERSDLYFLFYKGEGTHHEHVQIRDYACVLLESQKDNKWLEKIVKPLYFYAQYKYFRVTVLF